MKAYLNLCLAAVLSVGGVALVGCEEEVAEPTPGPVVEPVTPAVPPPAVE